MTKNLPDASDRQEREKTGILTAALAWAETADLLREKGVPMGNLYKARCRRMAEAFAALLLITIVSCLLAKRQAPGLGILFAREISAWLLFLHAPSTVCYILHRQPGKAWYYRAALVCSGLSGFFLFGRAVKGELFEKQGLSGLTNFLISEIAVAAMAAVQYAGFCRALRPPDQAGKHRESDGGKGLYFTRRKKMLRCISVLAALTILSLIIRTAYFFAVPGIPYYMLLDMLYVPLLYLLYVYGISVLVYVMIRKPERTWFYLTGLLLNGLILLLLVLACVADALSEGSFSGMLTLVLLFSVGPFMLVSVFREIVGLIRITRGKTE